MAICPYSPIALNRHGDWRLKDNKIMTTFELHFTLNGKPGTFLVNAENETIALLKLAETLPDAMHFETKIIEFV